MVKFKNKIKSKGFAPFYSEGHIPENLILITLVLTMLIPNMTLAYPMASDVMEHKNLNKNITREELATIGVRLYGIEDSVKYHKGKSQFKDVSGWSVPYVNVAYQEGIMQGVGKNQFKPKAKVKYIELLTIIMRSMGYKDGVDFQKYPEDYYNKALEIGLADLYIPYNEVITRQVVWDTLEKLQGIDQRDEKEIPVDENPTDYQDVSKISIEDIGFSTSIVGSFSGKLTGLSDFNGYRIELLSNSGKVYEKKTLGRDGSFSITGFDIGFTAKLGGYKYRVYDNMGGLVLKGDL